MAELHARVPGDSIHDQATRLAGSIAELGSTQLELHEPSGMIRQLRARATDLPALLQGLALDAAAPPPLLRIPRLGVVITITPSGLIWSARDPAAAKRFDDHLITTTA